MDFVYLCRPTPNNNAELRYSLRSLRNVTHDRVFVVGTVPDWIRNVIHIPHEPRCEHKQQNSADALAYACGQVDVDEFVYMNDDFFIMRPVDSIPILNRGDLISQVESRNQGNIYTQRLAATLKWLVRNGIPDPISYDGLHTPFPVKTGIMEMAARIVAQADPPLLTRSIYGNLADAGGTETVDAKFVQPFRQAMFLSTNKTLWRGERGRYIRSRFRKASVYEASR